MQSLCNMRTAPYSVGVEGIFAHPVAWKSLVWCREGVVCAMQRSSLQLEVGRDGLRADQVAGRGERCSGTHVHQTPAG